MVNQWNTETHNTLESFPDPELATTGCAQKNHLIQTTERHVLLATDLHSGNVLKSQRKPWLVIDIKPYIGDPAYDLTQHLLNCKGRLQSKPLDTLNRLADLAEVNALRLRVLGIRGSIM